MSLETRIASLASAIGQKIKQLISDIEGKVNSSGQTPNGYLTTNSEGDVVVDTTPLATTTPTDDVEYVMKNGVWIQLTRATEISWSNVSSKPTEFTPEAHTHDDRYYTETEIDSFLSSKSDSSHTHDDRYYTQSEIINLLGGKADTVHNHDDRYYTETEVDDKLENKSDLLHAHDDRYYTETEVDDKLEVLENIIYTGNSYTPEGGIEVILSEGKTLGKYSNGDIIPGNTSVLQVLNQAVTEYIPAEFILPEAVLSSSISVDTEIELGESVDIDFTLNLIQNNGGSATGYSLLKDGTEIYASTDTGSHTHALVGTLSPIVFFSEISYAEGTGTLENSLGEAESNSILAGAATSNELIFYSYYPIFYGPTSFKNITPGDIRSNLSKRLFNSELEFILDTGTVEKIFQFWLPNSATLVKVVDEDAGNFDITSMYLEDSINALDAGGNSIAGTLYTYEQAIPYSINHKHKITITS